MSIAGLDPATPGSTSGAGRGDDEIRALKQALQNVLIGLDSLVESGVGNGAMTSAELTALFDRVTAVEGSIGAAFVVGHIILWSGTAETVPTGWTICDGSNGTPDMRVRFAFGADSVTGVPTVLGLSQGGNTTKTTGSAGGHDHSGSAGNTALSANQIPDISSNLRIAVDEAGQADSHNVATYVARGRTGDTPSDESAPLSTTGLNGANHTHSIGTDGAHTHTVSEREPFTALYFIMYTG